MYFEIGKIIKSLRKQRGMTQEELAGHLMDRTTLSRIESGSSIPSKRVLRLLLEKLCFNSTNVPAFFLSDEDVKYQQLIDDTDSSLAYGKYEEAEKLIAVLENDIEFMKSNFNAQYVQISKALVQYHEADDIMVFWGSLIDAMKITIPAFTIDKISEYFLSKQEIVIINKIAECYYDIEQLDVSISIFTALKENFDNKYLDKDFKGKYYSSILNGLAFYLSHAEKHNEVIEICDEGIEVCRSTGYLFRLPHFIFDKAVSLYALDNKEEAERLMKMAYNGFLMYDQSRKALEAKEFALDNFGIVLH